MTLHSRDEEMRLTRHSRSHQRYDNLPTHRQHMDDEVKRSLQGKHQQHRKHSRYENSCHSYTGRQEDQGDCACSVT